MLLSLKCYVCSAISTTTESPYNHSGLVIEADQSAAIASGVEIAQALGATEALPLEQFIKQAPKGSSVAILRSKELAALFALDPPAYKARVQKMRQFFLHHMLGRTFDNDYLWDNKDDAGRELLYCSEMVQKTLNQALQHQLSPVPLDYSRMWDFWYDYFAGQVPQGEPGNSPASLARAPELTTIYVGPWP